MDSKQIKAALKPFVDFAPAIMKAAEIVEAVEKAEAELKSLPKRKADLEADIGELERRKEEAMQKRTQAGNDFRAFVAAHEEKKQAVRAETEAVNQALAKARETLAALDSEYNEKKKAKQAEIDEAQNMLSKVRAEIDRLKKAFAA
jgi:chromosome segregation ATPase